MAPLPEPHKEAEPERNTGDCLRESGDKPVKSGRAVEVGESPAIGVAGAVVEDEAVVT